MLLDRRGEHTVRIVWDITKKECLFLVDDARLGQIDASRLPETSGVSYLGLRSTAAQRDPQGLLVERISST